MSYSNHFTDLKTEAQRNKQTNTYSDPTLAIRIRSDGPCRPCYSMHTLDTQITDQSLADPRLHRPDPLQISNRTSEQALCMFSHESLTTRHISDGSTWQKGKNSSKNFKEIADLLFITKGLTRWLFNLTARTFDDNQQFNFFLNLDFFFSFSASNTKAG